MLSKIYCVQPIEKQSEGEGEQGGRRGNHLEELFWKAMALDLDT